MGMNLGIQTAAYGAPENQEWLGSAHGTQEMDSITLDGASFAAKFATGLVPSGVPLTKLAGGKYAPAIKGDVTGLQVVSGFLFTTVDLTAGGQVAAATDTPASLYWHGEVVAAKLPVYTTSYVAADFPLTAALSSNISVRTV